jgi:excisionase family DNA binding protein
MGAHIANTTQNTTLILRPKNAAKTLGVSIATFWRLVQNGDIRTIKIGKRATGVRITDLDAFLESRAVVSAGRVKHDRQG